MASIPSTSELRAHTQQRRARRLPRPLSEATLARITSVVLWALVILAGFGGLGALIRTNTADNDSRAEAAPTKSDDGRWTAAGVAERYVGTYLLAGPDGKALVPFLGYTPELPANAKPAEIAAPIRTVEVDQAADDYWSVTVSVGPPGHETFWRAAIDVSGRTPVAVGLPAAVSSPPEVERIDLDVTLGPPPADDPAVETVTGFLGAYLCGQADLARYLQPGLDLTATNPAVCSEIELTRWGSIEDGDKGQIVVTDAVLSSGKDSPTWQATYAVALAQRDGRWEVAELLPAPPRDGDPASTEGATND